MSSQVRWPTQKFPRTTEVELYPAFDETLTTGLEDTVRNLKVMREKSHSDEESQRWQLQAVTDLRDEVKTLRKEMGNLVRALDKKVSIMAQGKFEKSLSERIDNRIDKIRNIAMWAIGILFIVIGIIKAVH